MLPPKKQRPQKVKKSISSGSMGPKIERRFQGHRAFVRKHQCCVKGCTQGPIEFAHIDRAGGKGTGLKVPDWWGVSLCSRHHRECHDKGAVTFERKYGLDLVAIADEFAARSPQAYRMKQARAEFERFYGMAAE